MPSDPGRSGARTRQLVALVALGALALLVAWLAMRNPKPPWIPADQAHAGFVSGERCRVCHGAEGPSPQSPNHPLGLDCTRCHAFRK